MSRCVPPVRLAAFAREQLQEKRAAEVRLHVAACAACRAGLDRIESAQDAMRVVARSPAPEASPAANARGEATVRWSRVAPARRVSPWLWGALGLSAAAAGLVIFLPRARPPVHVAALPPPPPAPVPAPAPPEVQTLEATLTLLGGQVDLTRDGKTARLVTGERLRASDGLVTHTDSRVAAQWGEGSGFLLLADAQLAIDQLDRTSQRLHVERGQVDVRVGPHQPGELMRVRSNAHIMTVRGTWFTVAAAGERTTVEVLEGVVEVSELDGSASTILRAPARAVFGQGGHVSSSPVDAREMAQLREHAHVNLMSPAELIASGTFTVDTKPAGEVAVDGVELGSSPLTVRRPLGNHYVEVARPRYKPVRQWITVGAEPGELRVALVRAPSAALPDGNEPVAVEDMVKLRQRQIRACYERSLKRDPSLTGTVSLKLQVGPAGQVTQALVEAAASTLSDVQVASCLEHEASTWRFASGNATVVYPLVFRPE